MKSTNKLDGIEEIGLRLKQTTMGRIRVKTANELGISTNITKDVMKSNQMDISNVGTALANDSRAAPLPYFTSPTQMAIVRHLARLFVIRNRQEE